MFTHETYKCRGKRKDTKEWVFGDVGSHSGTEAFILDRPYIAVDGSLSAINVWEVEPETVSRWSGITDANNVQIFPGDIVRLHQFVQMPAGDGGMREEDKELIATIEQWDLGLAFRAGAESGYLAQCLECPSEELEVIGNIYDNPHLLEV